MLEFFRKYQRSFMIAVAVVIIISFSFFGTYSALGSSDGKREVVVGRLVDGSKLYDSEVRQMVAWLGKPEVFRRLVLDTGAGAAIAGTEALKGIPLRLEIGEREMESSQLSLLRRDRPHKERIPLSKDELAARIPSLLQEIQDNLLAKATAFRNQHTVRIDSLDAFRKFFSADESGFALCHWNEDPIHEAKVKEEFNVTIRCIPLHAESEPGRCIFTGEPSPRRVIFAKSY